MLFPSIPLGAPLEAGALSLGSAPAGDPMIPAGGRAVGGARLYKRHYEQHSSAQPLAWSPEYYLSSPLLSCCPAAVLLSCCPAAAVPLSCCCCRCRPASRSHHPIPAGPVLPAHAAILPANTVFHADWAMARREEQNGNGKELEAVPVRKMQREDVWKSKKKKKEYRTVKMLLVLILLC